MKNLFKAAVLGLALTAGLTSCSEKKTEETTITNEGGAMSADSTAMAPAADGAMAPAADGAMAPAADGAMAPAADGAMAPAADGAMAPAATTTTEEKK